ncbi:MAG: hypothetical protein DBY30_06900 [Verrucomicrobia bacterium]|nr:MAG: hypothetical protein DBY30_06900 [Verrucomicrobiota bacterium]
MTVGSIPTHAWIKAAIPTDCGFFILPTGVPGGSAQNKAAAPFAKRGAEKALGKPVAGAARAGR